MRVIETVDIHQIINEAMEKKDRYVNLNITCDGISLTINPIVTEVPSAVTLHDVEGNTYKYGSDLDAWREDK